MEIKINQNTITTNGNHRITESISSSVSIEGGKGKNLLETLTGMSGLINSESITRIFVKNKEDLNAKNECDWTPLFRTIIYENNRATEHLLKMGADPNIQCNMGETALYQAVEMGKEAQVETLLKYGADPNLPRIDGWTPLHAAVLKSNISMVESLLKSGGDANVKNKLFAQTPVHFAIKHNINPTILLLLVRHNGSLVMRDKSNKRPLDYVETDEMREAISKLKTQKEDAFITPQKERVMSIHSNTTPNLEYKSNLAAPLEQCAAGNVGLNISNFQNENVNSNVTPTKKATNYIFKKLIIRTASAKKSSKKEENNFVSNAFSPSDYEREDTQGRDFTLDHKLSFVTHGVSKMNSPKEDGGISDVNPLDTLYSNYYTNNAQNAMTTSNENRKEENSRSLNYYNDSSSVVHITEEDYEDLTESKKDEGEFNFESLNINEDSLEIGKKNHYQNEIANENENENVDNEENDYYQSDDLQYTPSKTSYIVSSLPVTDQKADESIVESEAKKEVNRRLSFNEKGKQVKIKYHKERKDTISRTYSKKERSNHYLKECKELGRNSNCTMNEIYLNSNPSFKKADLGPEYIRKINFSNIQTNPILIEDDRFYCRSPAHHATQSHYITNSEINRGFHTGNNSTRNTSAIYLPDERLKSMGIKKLYINEPINQHDTSNKTIIHYGMGETIINTGGNHTNCHTLYHMTNPSTRPREWKKHSNMTEMSGKNSPSSRRYIETVYPATETKGSNIDTSDAKRLHDWLDSIGMLTYYSNFLEKGVFSVDKMIQCMSDPNNKITYRDLEEVGIRKPGHIYRMLLKLEIDAKIIDEGIFSFLFTGKENPMKQSSLSKCNLRVSNEKYVCCGIINSKRIDVSNGDNKKKKLANDGGNYDLVAWLKNANLPSLKKNFNYNGFDSIEFFILQMFSSFPIDDYILEDSLHIYSKKERRVILNELDKEVRTINSKLYNQSNSLLEGMKFNISSTKFERENIEEGCKMCTIF